MKNEGFPILVLMNKETGALGLGMRMVLFDKEPIEPMASIEGYSIRMVHETEFDMWMIFSGEPKSDGPWLMVNRKAIDAKCEVLCNL